MSTRIEILAHKDDGRAKKIENTLKTMGVKAYVRTVDVYSSQSVDAEKIEFPQSLTNPITQKINQTPIDFNWALEIGFLPGVTDNIGNSVSEILTLIADNDSDHKCYSSQLFLIKANINHNQVVKLSEIISNKLIQRISIKNIEEYKRDGGMDVIIPKVILNNVTTAADQVDINITDTALEDLSKYGIGNSDGSKRGPLGLPLPYLKAIQAYFKKEGRLPTDIEIETLAQTWSEHCKHTIFASPIDEITDGLYKHYIKRATKEIRASRGKDDICVSVFSDNAGAIIFDDNYLITDKVETHNSPSALDPFGGAITGIVGVNRDCMGFGMGAKPIINRYGFCLADPRTTPNYFRDKKCTDALLPPSNIMTGVIAGVESGGNCSGIPTPSGFVYFDDRFAGKPLVFVGTVGLIPREINGKAGHEKCARAGDKIVVAGGRVGADGIHGATFSSVALDESSPATAVQIGDPITQKKMSDAIIKEIRDFSDENGGWYNAITDNGAGGLSSSVGEMAEGSGGFHLEIEKVPLKYQGLSPWEIWISESQERMTFAVPPENTDKLVEFFAKRGVEATVIGTYTDSGRAKISWNDEVIMDLDMDFLHDGNPETPLITTFTRGGDAEPDLLEPESYEDALTTMLGRLNICSKEFISTQYDHNVQGTVVLGPLQGRGRVYGEVSITRPILDSNKGVVLSQALFPRYSDIDTAAMAAAGLDMAVRGCVAAGVDFNQLALLDNFCWCSSDEPERLGQLKRAAKTIYDLATKYQTPFVSGKDSMFNDFKGYDEDGKSIKISAPPTLLISSIGVIPHVECSISIAPKAAGDSVYLLGITKDELGASEYYDELGHLGNNVPETDAHQNLRLYKLYARASRDRLIASAMAVGYGGLGVTLAKKSIAGGFGLDIDLSGFDLRADKMLFSESTGRIIVTVAPQNKKAFERNFKGFEECHYIGSVSYSENLFIRDIIKIRVTELEKSYKSTFKDY